MKIISIFDLGHYLVIITIDLSENRTRKMIFNHISTHPGVSFSIIKKVFDLTESTLRYHLNYLESHKEIKSNIVGKNKCYYLNQNYIFNPRIDTEPSAYRLNRNQELLISAIQHHPGITQKELLFKTGLKRITLAQNIRKLLDYGVVRKEPNGRFICYYYISDKELREKILKRLITKLLNDEIDEKTFLALKRKLR